MQPHGPAAPATEGSAKEHSAQQQGGPPQGTQSSKDIVGKAEAGSHLSKEEEVKLSARLVDIYARLEEIDAYGGCWWVGR